MMGHSKLPMLCFELKRSSHSVDLANPLKKFIREYYGELGENYSKEIKEFETLRNEAVNVSRSVRDVNGCSMLKRYYAQIYTLYNKAKIMNGSLESKFIWFDIYSNQETTGDLQFELDCIIYNIGAIHSELGAQDTRSNAESMKIACTHFQCAAWAFEQLKDHPHNYKSKDISHDVIAFMYQTMLGQAQECILEKSILDSRKSSIISKVAAQVVEFYDNALMILIQGSLNGNTTQITDIIGSKLFKTWKRLIEFKIFYFNAICCYYMASYSEELQKMGERIAWYLSGEEHLKQAEKLIKSGNKSEFSELLSAFDFLSNELKTKLEIATKENNFVYHEPVPTSNKLTAVKGVLLVKGISFSVTDPEVAGNDIFANLVPIEAHEVASIYSANKDKLLRNIRNQLEEKNEELLTYMSSLQLEKENLHPVINTIPDELIEICAALSIKPNVIKQEKASFQCLEEISQGVDKNIKEADHLITEEKEKEKNHQEIYGKRAPSLILVELEKELKKHQETHRKAIDSNKNLKQALEKYSTDVQLMIDCSSKNLADLLPLINDIPFDEGNVKEIERLLDKVQEMKDQRALLEKQLREGLQNDDVLRHVLTHSRDEIESVFDKELKKYDDLINLLTQNMSAQENILNALTKASASYGKARIALNEINRLRDSRIKSFIYSYESFIQVSSNIDKGLEFYKNFETLIAKLLSRIKSVIKVQEEERLQFGQVQITKETKKLNEHVISDKNTEINSNAPKLKDFLPYLNFNQSTNSSPAQILPSHLTSLTTLNNPPLPSSDYIPFNHPNHYQPSSNLPLNSNQSQFWSSSKQCFSQTLAPSINNISLPSFVNSSNLTYQQPSPNFVSTSSPNSNLIYSMPITTSNYPNNYAYPPQSSSSTSYFNYLANGTNSYDNLQNMYQPSTLMLSQWPQYQDQSQAWNIDQQSKPCIHLPSQSVPISNFSQPLNSQNYFAPTSNSSLVDNQNEAVQTSILQNSQLSPSQSNQNIQTHITQSNHQYQSNPQATMLPSQNTYYSLANQTSQNYGQRISNYVHFENSQVPSVYPEYSNISWQYLPNNVSIMSTPITNTYPNQPYTAPPQTSLPSNCENNNQNYSNQVQSLNSNEPLISLSPFEK